MFRTIFDLPEEVLLNISHRLHAKNLLRFGKACTFFNRISGDIQLWKNLVGRDFGIHEMHQHDNRNWKELYGYLYANAVNYAGLLITAFKFPYDENFPNYYSPGYNFLEHAKIKLIEIEEKLGEINTLYIYQYLIRKTDFVSSIPYVTIEDVDNLNSVSTIEECALRKITLYSPIHVLAHVNKGEIIKLIHEVNPTLLEVWGYGFTTPLHVAAMEGSLAAAETLISLGATHISRIISDDDETTPFMSALHFGQTELYPLLSSGHPPIDPVSVREFPEFEGFEFKDEEENEREYMELYTAETSHLLQSELLRLFSEDEDPIQLVESQEASFQEYLNDLSNGLNGNDGLAKLKKGITWLATNSFIDGKEVINQATLLDAFNITKEVCELHNEWLGHKRKRQNNEPSSNLDHKNEPEHKRRKLV